MLPDCRRIQCTRDLPCRQGEDVEVRNLRLSQNVEVTMIEPDRLAVRGLLADDEFSQCESRAQP